MNIAASSKYLLSKYVVMIKYHGLLLWNKGQELNKYPNYAIYVVNRQVKKPVMRKLNLVRLYYLKF